MPRFKAPPPNGDSRKALQQRAREATRPAEPEKKGSWPFSANKCRSWREGLAGAVSPAEARRANRGLIA